MTQTETAPAPETAGHTYTHPWPALWALVIGFFMILIDTTIVSVATPTIMVSLNADVSAVIWVSSAYLLTYAVPLLITGRLGDRFGPKNIYMIGLAIFTLSSLWCGLSGWLGERAGVSGIAMLITARAVQGLGAAMMTPQTMAVITRTFPPQRRGAAMGLWGSVAGVATLVGPILGGVLVDAAGWEWIFFVNLPVGVIAFVAAAILVPRLPTHSHRFDLVGVGLSAAALFLIVFGLQEGHTYDWGAIWGPITVWELITAGVIILAAFVLWQTKAREPLVPLRLFRDRNFSAANLAISATGFIVTSMAFPLQLYAQTARGLTPTEAACLMIPMAVISGVLAPLVGRMINRRDPRPITIAAFALLAAALVGFWFVLDPSISVLWLLVPAAVMGLANAGIWSPLSITATRNLAPGDAGAGSGVYNTTRQIGSVLGSAAIVAMMEVRLTANLPGYTGGAEMGSASGSLPEAVAAPFSAAMGQSLLLPAAVAVVGIVCAVFFTKPRFTDLR